MSGPIATIVLTPCASAARPTPARPPRRRALIASLLLHLLVPAALLIAALLPRTQRIAAPNPPITVLTLGAPSQTQQAGMPAAAMPAAAPASTRKPAARPRPKARVASRPETSTVAVNAPEPTPVAVTEPTAVTATTGTPATLGTTDTSSVAAATPDANARVPPPLEYLRRIARIISRSQQYPWSARQYGHQGDAIVRMHLSRDGRVMTATLIRSSGHVALDAEARDVVLRIARFPPFPSDYIPQQREFDIDQPVTFRTYLN